MKATLKIEKEFELKTLKAQVHARYWEDGTLNGEEDTDGNMPCRQGDCWCPTIDIDTGVITNWEQGNTASLHYKSCDMNTVQVYDDQGEKVIDYDGYVPDCLCPKGGGYGDYVKMDIDEDGKIANWRFTSEQVEDLVPNEDY